MVIGDRLRALREEKQLSQGHIEKRTGLLRCYVSRVENGHTIPSIETLEKWARALEVPLYQIFYAGEEPPSTPQPATATASRLWGSEGRDARLLTQLRRTLSKTQESDRQLLLHMARKLAKAKVA
jgi:transcriptional regulator with XRE-family HTH domain